MIYWIQQFFTRPRTHGSALAEVLVTSILALTPLMSSALLYSYINPQAINLSDALKQAIGGGQLFLFAYSVFGTIIWLAFIKWDKEMHGPRRLFGFIALALTILIVPLLGLDPTLSKAKNQVIVTASYCFYGAFLCIYYLLLFYLEIDPPPADESLKSGSQKLKARYQSMGDESHG